MANTLILNLAQMSAQPSDAEALYNFMQAVFDALITGRVKSATTTAQPGSPAEEDVYILPTSSTGTNWAGNDGKVAVRVNGTWYFYAQREGMRFYVEDEDAWIRSDGSAWLWEGNASIASVTAAGNNSQTNATQLTREVSIVTGVVPATTTGVKLSAAAKGKRMVVYNADSGDTLDVFPASGDAIDGGAADAKVTIAAGKSRIFWALDTTNWYSHLGA